MIAWGSEMPTLRIALLGALLVATAATPATATIIWGFYETGISFCNSGFCNPPLQPRLLMDLTLSSDTSTGSAQLGGPGGQPVVTNSDFTFTLSTGERIGAPDYGANPQGFLTILSYNISWTEGAGQLGVSVTLNGESETVGGSFHGSSGFGPFGGPIASDDGFGGCDNTQCVVTGFWAEIPEPGSAILLLGALVSFGFVRRGRPHLTLTSQFRRNRL
jgi:hypothetical protein